MGPQQTTTQGYVLWWTVGWLERRIIRKDAMVDGLVSDRVSEWVILWGIVCVDEWLKPNIHRTITPRHTTRLHFKPLLLPYISIFYGQLIIGNPIIIITRLTVGWSPHAVLIQLKYCYWGFIHISLYLLISSEATRIWPYRNTTICLLVLCWPLTSRSVIITLPKDDMPELY